MTSKAPSTVANLKRYLRQWKQHCRNPAAIAFGILVAGFIVAFALWSGNSCLEQGIRWAGLALQLAGLITVAVGLRSSRKLFAKPTFKQAIGLWFVERPRWKLKPVYASGAGISIGADRAHGVGTTGPAPGASLQQRVERLEESTGQLFTGLALAKRQIAMQSDRLDDEIKREKQERSVADSQIEERLATAVVGGLHIEFVGLISLLVGSVASTMSVDFYRWFGGFSCLT